MKFKSRVAIFLASLMAVSAMGRDASPSSKTTSPPDKEKLSYAIGMRTGIQMLHANTNLDVLVAAQAFEDVMTGKPTMIQEAEIAPLLNEARNAPSDQAWDNKQKISYAAGMRVSLRLKQTGADLDPKIVSEAVHDLLSGKPKMQESEIAPLLMQAEAYEAGRKVNKSKSSGAAFLAKNAKEPGVTVLPDGLQYKVLVAGTGAKPTTNDLIFVKYRGMTIDGTQFDRHDHFLTKTDGGIQCWQEALQRMKVGDKWQVVSPPALAYGDEGQQFRGIGPDTTVIFELELLAIAPPGDYQVSSGVGHGLDVGATTPSSKSSSK